MRLHLTYGTHKDLNCVVEWAGESLIFRQLDAVIVAPIQICGRLGRFLHEIEFKNLDFKNEFILSQSDTLPGGDFQEGKKPNPIMISLASDSPETSEDIMNCISLHDEEGNEISFLRTEACFLLDLLEGVLKRNLLQNLETQLENYDLKECFD